MDEAIGRVPEELIAPRPQYDVSRPFDQLVRPHFFASSNQGELEEIQGKPDLIVEWQGRVKVRLKQDQQPQYLDLLALESELLGEHPNHKILRLRAMGIPIADDLESKLRSSSSAHRLFHTLDFEYLPGKETKGVIAEVFPDGTFLVIPFGTPSEWRSSEATPLTKISQARIPASGCRSACHAACSPAPKPISSQSRSGLARNRALGSSGRPGWSGMRICGSSVSSSAARPGRSLRPWRRP